MRASSAGVSMTRSAPNDSVSCARVRAPMTGTMVEPFANTHAMASCEALTSFSAASCQTRVRNLLRQADVHVLAKRRRDLVLEEPSQAAMPWIDRAKQ
jgi:hypothetical protein